jgi:hypothetical protein
VVDPAITALQLSELVAVVVSCLTKTSDEKILV